MDLTSVANVTQYGGAEKNTDDTLLQDLITGLSAQVENACNQTFGVHTVTNLILPARIDAAGRILCWLRTPVATVTAYGWRQTGVTTTFTALDVTTLDVRSQQFGAKVYSAPSYAAYRWATLDVQVSYSGGWATLGDVPKDFELAMRRLVWWAYKKRSAPMEKMDTASGTSIYVPDQWPADIRRAFVPYTRVVMP